MEEIKGETSELYRKAMKKEPRAYEEDLQSSEAKWKFMRNKTKRFEMSGACSKKRIYKIEGSNFRNKKRNKV